MKRTLLTAVALCLLLCGCTSWMDGSYLSVTPHYENRVPSNQDMIEVSSYVELRDAVTALVEDGAESATFSVEAFDPEQAEDYMEMALRYASNSDPIGVYAVESTSFEEGTIAGVRAVAVKITYNYSRVEIRRIRRVQGMNRARDLIVNALESCEQGVVLLVSDYRATDFTQMIRDYADSHPESVMEVPEVTANIYPDSGQTRLVELKFAYQNSRDTLRSMQTQVQRVFGSAGLYVSSEAPDREKFSLLASFLTNLAKQHDYHFETSITPPYSLLCHGVGDSKAYAVAYAAMCRQAGVECQVVSGAKEGEPWFWNIIRDGDVYCHVDLIDFSQSGVFAERSDEEMAEYVWDYSAYPPCEGVAEEPEQGTEPSENGEDVPAAPAQPEEPPATTKPTAATEPPAEAETTAPTEPPVETETTAATEPSEETEPSTAATEPEPPAATPPATQETAAAPEGTDTAPVTQPSTEREAQQTAP